VTDQKTSDDATHPPAVRQDAGVPAAAGTPNPQGKGAVGFLLDWEQTAPRAVTVKRPGRILADYFTSLLVLSSAFRFRPAFGQTYHLYRSADRWLLSLISPEEWKTPEKREAYVGACVLHRDSTWSIEPSANVGRPGPVTDALAATYEAFLVRLNSEQPLEDELPIHEGRMPYYQRLFAASLSRSIRGSLTAGGQTGRAASAWLESLPGDAGRLLLRGTRKD